MESEAQSPYYGSSKSASRPWQAVLSLGGLLVAPREAPSENRCMVGGRSTGMAFMNSPSSFVSGCGCWLSRRRLQSAACEACIGAALPGLAGSGAAADTTPRRRCGAAGAWLGWGRDLKVVAGESWVAGTRRRGAGVSRLKPCGDACFGSMNAMPKKLTARTCWRNPNLATSSIAECRLDVRFPKNDKSLPSLAAKQGQIGGWEFATLSFPCRH